MQRNKRIRLYLAGMTAIGLAAALLCLWLWRQLPLPGGASLPWLALLPLLTIAGVGIYFALRYLLERFTLRLTEPYAHMAQTLEEALKSEESAALAAFLAELRHYSELRPFIPHFEQLIKRLDAHIAEIRDRAEKTDHIIASMHEGLFMLGADMELLLCNRTALEFLGLESAGSETSFARLCRLPQLTEAVRLALETAAPHTLDIERNMPDSRKYRVNITPAVWESSLRGVIILISDITSWARYDQLRSEFVANVSHELKTPVTAIHGFAELLLSEAATDPAQVKRYNESILLQSKRLIHLIDDLLSLSALEHGAAPAAPVRVDLRRAAEEALWQLSKAMADKSVTAHITGEGFVMAQELHLSELAFNLIENAVKYNVYGGKIEVLVWQNGPESGIAVRDTGIGIPKMHQDRIFERFYRVDRGRSSKTGGTGLGLSIVKHIAEQYGGKIELVSTPGEGSTIQVRFPAAKSQ